MVLGSRTFDLNYFLTEDKESAKGRVQKKGEKCGLLPNQGGGSPRVKKNQTPFLEKYFFNELVESF